MSSAIFCPFQAHISPEFWQTLSSNKIDQVKLDAKDVRIVATYVAPSRNNASVSPARLDVDQNAFQVIKSPSEGHCIARGVVRNTNTIEEFKLCDKNAYLREMAVGLWEDIHSGAATEEPSLLSTFALLCFADLKKYVYTYWMAHPSFSVSWTYKSSEVLAEQDNGVLNNSVRQWRSRTDPSQWGFFVYDMTSRNTCKLSEWQTVPSTSRYFGFVDPSSSDSALGWPARSLLLLLKAGLKLKDINLLSFGETCLSRTIEELHCDDLALSDMPKPIGWERNAAGKLGPRMANLASVMDPTKLADDAVDLNLKLMKWRIAPELDLSKIKQTRCLLLGAGTLGCYVSRLLLGWGVETITFVDSGRVSFSNPVRQPLFNFADCLNDGAPKAQAAADALQAIYPGVNATGHQLTVPMIGHPFTSTEHGRAAYEQLDELISNHDVIMLLMDSRESRWLPTVMGSSKEKIVINAALGFDTFVVIRHGIPSDSMAQEMKPQTEQLGCYFCNDVVAPMDSMTDRTLDQQCTVTRPGIAALASATAVELLVSILQHPLGAACPASSETTGSENACVLGSIPHTIRGYLSSWNNKILTGTAYPSCSACSPAVLAAYRSGGWDFVERACMESGWVEELCGLKKVQSTIEGVDVDWDSEDDGDLV